MTAPLVRALASFRTFHPNGLRVREGHCYEVTEDLPLPNAPLSEETLVILVPQGRAWCGPRVAQIVPGEMFVPALDGIEDFPLPLPLGAGDPRPAHAEVSGGWLLSEDAVTGPALRMLTLPDASEVWLRVAPGDTYEALLVGPSTMTGVVDRSPRAALSAVLDQWHRRDQED